MRVAENIARGNPGLQATDYDARIMFGYAISSVAFLIIIYAASMSAGTAVGDFASMVVFP